MQTRLAALSFLLLASACTDSHGPGEGGCEGMGPICTLQASSGCCTDFSPAAECVDGSWACPSGAIEDALCSCYEPMVMVDSGPEPVDAGPVDAGPVDAGPGPADAGPSPCDGLAAAACLGTAGCDPVFDDACCPDCMPSGGCADCADPTYVDCVPSDPAGCPTVPACGTVPAWTCSAPALDCSDAHVFDVDSCSIPGCVPAYPPGDGEPSTVDAECVPITADSCTVSCRRVAPECPEGTVPQGDGFCYTDRCVPAFVCE